MPQALLKVIPLQGRLGHFQKAFVGHGLAAKAVRFGMSPTSSVSLLMRDDSGQTVKGTSPGVVIPSPKIEVRLPLARSPTKSGAAWKSLVLLLEVGRQRRRGSRGGEAEEEGRRGGGEEGRRGGGEDGRQRKRGGAWGLRGERERVILSVDACGA